MREKRSFKQTTVNSSEVVIVGKDNSFVNGVYLGGYGGQSSLIVQKSDSNSKLEKKWNTMDHKEYLTNRTNGCAIDNDLMLTNGEENALENFSLSNTVSLKENKLSRISPQNVFFSFFKRFGPDYWNILPKTDYTYSPSSKYYKKEILPGVPIVPNLTRKAIHRESFGSPFSSYLELSSSADESNFNANIQASSSLVSERRNAQIYRQNNWIRNSWIQRTFETIKTVIITTITTSITSTIDTVLHPMRKPYITFPLIFLLLALLYYILLCTETEIEEGVTKTVPCMPLAWLQTHTETSSLGAGFSAIVFKSFTWAYKVIIASFQLLTTCVFMLPTILSQLVQSLNTCFFIFIQRIAAWAYPSPVGIPQESGIKFIKPSEKSSVIDITELKRTILDVLSERDLQKDVESRGVKRSEIEKAKELNDFIMKVSERLNSLESQLNYQEKVLDGIKPHLKELEEKFTQLTTGHNAEVASREGNSNVTSAVGWSEVSENVVRVVNGIIKQYHADRTGMPDYALLSNGGSIINVRCTQTYTKQSGDIYLLGFPIWKVKSTPEMIIQPGIMPGECWAFEGSQGYVTINLAVPIYISGFTMEHTPKELTPFGNINSAPYQFSVWALEHILDKNPEFLGRFKFLDNGESLQFFESEKLDKLVSIVELRIESNHGSINYTCLYRFRVHGTPA